MNSNEIETVWRSRCINPFKKKKHIKRTAWCPVSESLLVKFLDLLPEGSKICKTCQFEFKKYSAKVAVQSENEEIFPQSRDEQVYFE